MSREEKGAVVTALAACLLLSHALIYGAGYMHGTGDIIDINTKAARTAAPQLTPEDKAMLDTLTFQFNSSRRDPEVLTLTPTQAGRAHRPLTNAVLRKWPIGKKPTPARLSVMASTPKKADPPDRYRLEWIPKGALPISGQPGIEMHAGIYVPPPGVSYLGIGVAPSPDYKAVFVKE
jgi:hypothetical protein